MDMSAIRNYKQLEVSSSARICGLVVGMHRSGTSSVAGVLSLLGFVPPANLIGANKANPKGHWESSAVARLNDRIMQFADSHWRDWQPFNESWYDTPFLESFLKEAEDVLDAEFADSPMMVLKDPRISRLAKFWLQVLDRGNVQPVIFMPFRNPAEVAQSLEVRNGMSASTSELLWLRYVLDAELGTRHRSRFYFSYADFVANWRSVITRAKDMLGVEFPKFSMSTARKIDDFVDADLYRNRADHDHAGSTKLGAWATGVRDILYRWSQQGENADDHRELDRINAEFSRCVETSVPLWASLEHLEQESSQFASEVTDHRARVEATRKKLKTEGGDADGLLTNFVAQAEDHLAICESKMKSVSTQITIVQQEAATMIDALAAVHRHEVVGLHQDIISSVTARTLSTQSEAELRQCLSRGSEKLVSAYTDIVSLGNLLRNEEVKSASLQGEVNDCNVRIRASEKNYDVLLSKMELAKAEHQSSAELAKKREAELEQHIKKLEALNLELEGAANFEAAIAITLNQQLKTLQTSITRMSRIVQGMISKGILPRGGLRDIFKMGRWKNYQRQLASKGVFSNVSYLADNLDVAAAGADPLLHYLEFGLQENRQFNSACVNCNDPHGRLEQS